MHGGDFILEVGGGDWASHMMEHELGGMFDVATNTILSHFIIYLVL